MDAFNATTTPAQTFIAVDGQDVTVRPVADPATGRVYVEIGVQDEPYRVETVRLSPGILTLFTRAVLTAGFCAELVNVAAGTPSTVGE